MYLIKGGTVMTGDPERPCISQGAVAVKGGIIAAVGSEAELIERFPDLERIDALGGLIMPGLINAHTHLNRRFPGASDPKNSEDLPGLCESTDAACAALADSIRCGVTTLIDLYPAQASVSGAILGTASAAEASGIRACLSGEVSGEDGYAACTARIIENEDILACSSGRLRALFGLSEAFTLSEPELARCVSGAGNAGFHLPVSETMTDSIVCQRTYGMSPVRRLLEHGISGPGTVFAHCACISRDDAELIRSSGTNVVCSPQTDFPGPPGSLCAVDLIEMGVPVGLGSDGFTPDMLECARAFISRRFIETGTMDVGTAARLLFENNRIIASRIFGMDIGVLREGAAADITVTNGAPAGISDGKSLEAAVIMGMCGRGFLHVMADGRFLMRDRKLLTFCSGSARRFM